MTVRCRSPRANGWPRGIDGATLTVLDGRTHVPFVGDAHSVLNAMRRGLGLPPLDRGTPPTVTPRQLQVAALVAQGWSNRQIADELVITERTAESHVERIRDAAGLPIPCPDRRLVRRVERRRLTPEVRYFHC